MTGRRRANFALARRLPLSGGPPETPLVLDAARAVQASQRDRATGVADLDDDAPRAPVDAKLGSRPAPAQARDDASLIGGELERHAISIGTDAEVSTKTG
jgi:hypothetical protein